jgi:hypothetical protein
MNAQSSGFEEIMLRNVVQIDTTVTEEPSASFLRVDSVALTMP